MESLFAATVPYGLLGVRAVVVYVSVLVLLRISGKRQVGQMAATEFVALLLISNAVQNAMNGGDNSLIAGLFLAAVLILSSWLISYGTFRHPKIRALFEGTPTLLVHKSHLIHKNMVREKLTTDELKMLLRKQGIHSLEEISTAVLEADGTLTVTRAGEK